jgi:HK97 gp10 family phage protein
MMLGNFNNWFKVAAALKPACAEVVRDEVFFCADAIKTQIQANGQIDTGFMYDSVYAATVNESTYGGGTPPEDSYRLPEQQPENDQQGVVGVAANYGIYQNDGTRFMPARPFFEPGIELGRAHFDVEMATMETKIRARI